MHIKKSSSTELKATGFKSLKDYPLRLETNCTIDYQITKKIYAPLKYFYSHLKDVLIQQSYCSIGKFTNQSIKTATSNNCTHQPFWVCNILMVILPRLVVYTV